MIETTLVIIKPDAVGKRHIGAILARIEAVGLSIVCLRMEHLHENRVNSLYRDHVARPYYAEHAKFMLSGSVVLVGVEGVDACSGMRLALGPTDPARAKVERPGSLRALFGTNLPQNAIHASEDARAAQRELNLFWAVR